MFKKNSCGADCFLYLYLCYSLNTFSFNKYKNKIFFYIFYKHQVEAKVNEDQFIAAPQWNNISLQMSSPGSKLAEFVGLVKEIISSKVPTLRAVIQLVY